MLRLSLLLSLGIVSTLTAAEIPANLMRNPGFEDQAVGAKAPAHYDLAGAALWRYAGDKDEISTQGIVFPAHRGQSGEVSQMVTNIEPSKGRWLTFTFRGLAEDGFVVDGDALSIKMEFYSDGGTNRLDDATRLIYREILAERAQLKVNGNRGRKGGAVWRTYGLEELLPFDEVDSVKITVSYANGAATTPKDINFYLDDFSLVQDHASRTGCVDPATAQDQSAEPPAVDEKRLIPLGGRWYYRPLENEALAPPLVVTEENSDRLFYKTDHWTTPFFHNMTSWLRPGHLDVTGGEVRESRFLPDSVVVTFKNDGFLTMQAKNIPNHPTAKFPDTYGTQGYNPNSIQELDKTYRLPLEPTLDPKAKAMNNNNRNGALPGGSTGVAINGVVFYNPFDAGSMDATSIMDRCCGHPSPDNRYHYHKYPTCVNTPFVDKGGAHSDVLGFAFDGLPIYGPYEEAGIMARDSKTNPLNEFNAHTDEVRGWHYHVTPGEFPYVIGGYFAKVEPSNLERGPQRPPGGGPLPDMQGEGGARQGSPGGGRPPGRPRGPG